MTKSYNCSSPQPFWNRISNLGQSVFSRPRFGCPDPILPRLNGNNIAEMSLHDQNSSLERQVQYLDKAFKFVRKQHETVVAKLREEIESLRLENSKLQLDLTLIPIEIEQPLQFENSYSQVIEMLKQQIVELQSQLESKNISFAEFLKLDSDMCLHEKVSSHEENLGCFDVDVHGLVIRFEPFTVCHKNNATFHSPSLLECQSIIKSLKEYCDKLEKELKTIKRKSEMTGEKDVIHQQISANHAKFMDSLRTPPESPLTNQISDAAIKRIRFPRLNPNQLSKSSAPLVIQNVYHPRPLAKSDKSSSKSTSSKRPSKHK